MRTFEQKRKAINDRIVYAERRINDAIAENLPAYIVKARRNVLAVACSDSAMLEATIKLERVYYV